MWYSSGKKALIQWFAIRTRRMQPVIKKTRFALPLDEGISQGDLCDRFGISPANVGVRAKQKKWLFRT
ncbi:MULTISPECIES: hypothetical protein [Cyanophyceae]|uniref:hypothetical protein n=1 Tax=Cyanophyceae TaxID=3028117 RepID=UPI00168219C7|nr:hypothetical protein [Trichocoleus sp. FACHB-69]MBD1933724.1 hypothetical protein [Trichocoleus sp. FACHB-69]